MCPLRHLRGKNLSQKHTSFRNELCKRFYLDQNWESWWWYWPESSCVHRTGAGYRRRYRPSWSWACKQKERVCQMFGVPVCICHVLIHNRAFQYLWQSFSQKYEILLVFLRFPLRINAKNAWSFRYVLILHMICSFSVAADAVNYTVQAPTCPSR